MSTSLFNIVRPLAKVIRVAFVCSQSMIKKASLGVAVRSTAFSPNGELIAAGLKNGAFVLLRTADLKLVTEKRDRHGAIPDIRFASDTLPFILN